MSLRVVQGDPETDPPAEAAPSVALPVAANAAEPDSSPPVLLSALEFREPDPIPADDARAFRRLFGFSLFLHAVIVAVGMWQNPFGEERSAGGADELFTIDGVTVELIDSVPEDGSVGEHASGQPATGKINAATPAPDVSRLAGATAATPPRPLEPDITFVPADAAIPQVRTARLANEVSGRRSPESGATVVATASSSEPLAPVTAEAGTAPDLERRPMADAAPLPEALSSAAKAIDADRSRRVADVSPALVAPIVPVAAPPFVHAAVPEVRVVPARPVDPIAAMVDAMPEIAAHHQVLPVTMASAHANATVTALPVAVMASSEVAAARADNSATAAASVSSDLVAAETGADRAALVEASEQSPIEAEVAPATDLTPSIAETMEPATASEVGGQAVAAVAMTGNSAARIDDALAAVRREERQSAASKVSTFDTGSAVGVPAARVTNEHRAEVAPASAVDATPPYDTPVTSERPAALSAESALATAVSNDAPATAVAPPSAEPIPSATSSTTPVGQSAHKQAAVSDGQSTGEELQPVPSVASTAPEPEATTDTAGANPTSANEPESESDPLVPVDAPLPRPRPLRGAGPAGQQAEAALSEVKKPRPASVAGPPRTMSTRVSKPPRTAAAPSSSAQTAARGPTPGTAGAGGSNREAQGRASVSSYQATLFAHLRRFSRMPPEARQNGISGTANVTFTIDAGGRVLSASLSRSAGSSILDREALAIVRRASPFPPMPQGLGPSRMTVRAPIRFDIR